MDRMYVLERIFYGDFDIRLTEPVFISADKQTLVEKTAELNVMRTKQDLKNEVSFEVNPNSIAVI